MEVQRERETTIYCCEYGRCRNRVPDDDLEKLIQSYKEMSNHSAFYQQCNSGDSHIYNIRGKRKVHRVCSKFFQKIFGPRLPLNGSPSLKAGPPRVSNLRNRRAKIAGHIKSYPQFTCRISSSQFFNPGITLENMFRDFRSEWLKNYSLLDAPSLSDYRNVLDCSNIKFSNGMDLFSMGTFDDFARKTPRPKPSTNSPAPLKLPARINGQHKALTQPSEISKTCLSSSR